MAFHPHRVLSALIVLTGKNKTKAEAPMTEHEKSRPSGCGWGAWSPAQTALRPGS